MFKQLIANNYVKHLQDSALPCIKIDRLRDIKIYEYIVKYISDEQLILSDIPLLLNTQKYWERFQIYDIDVDKVARQLIKQLCETFGNNFLLKIVDNNKQYNIEYNLKIVCSITYLLIYKKYSVIEFIQPIKIDFKLTTGKSCTINLLPPILELINLYRDLYTPNMAENWPTILSNIKQIEVIVDKTFKEILADTDNFKQLPITSTIIKTVPLIHQPNDSEKLNLKQPLLDFFSDGDYLFVEHCIKNDDVLTVISKNAINYDFENLSNYLNKLITYGIIYRELDLFIPNEFLLKKYHVYVTYNNGTSIVKKHILTIYNNLSYELLNYTLLTYKDVVYKIIDPITELRFIYIELWYIIVAKQIERFSNPIFLQNLTEKIYQLSQYKKSINIFEFKKNYIGIYIDVIISKKMTAQLNLVQSKNNFYCYEL